jgi:eukaryotic translation initiation factor 2-alpha kinase 4
MMNNLCLVTHHTSQGKGGFGNVVKAKNKLDGRICAIKKVKLRGTENDDKIFREVNALSRLNHRYIVRYYATWLETVHRRRRTRRNSLGDWDSGDDDDDDDDTTDSDTTASGKKPRRTKEFDEENMLGYDLDDLTVHSRSRSGRSFPSIHFGEETSSKSILADDEDDEGEDSDAEEEEVQSPTAPRPKPVPRILYIQMVRLEMLHQWLILKALQEFVDQQTLREVSFV